MNVLECLCYLQITNLLHILFLFGEKVLITILNKDSLYIVLQKEVIDYTQEH